MDCLPLFLEDPFHCRGHKIHRQNKSSLSQVTLFYCMGHKIHRHSVFIIIIIIMTTFYVARYQFRSKHFTVIITPVIGFRITSALTAHFLHSLGSIPGQSTFYKHAHANSTTIPFAILPDPHLHTWVESSNVDKISC